jgi:hypothetical protein
MFLSLSGCTVPATKLFNYDIPRVRSELPQRNGYGDQPLDA